MICPAAPGKLPISPRRRPDGSAPSRQESSRVSPPLKLQPKVCHRHAVREVQETAGARSGLYHSISSLKVVFKGFRPLHRRAVAATSKKVIASRHISAFFRTQRLLLRSTPFEMYQKVKAEKALAEAERRKYDDIKNKQRGGGKDSTPEVFRKPVDIRDDLR